MTPQKAPTKASKPKGKRILIIEDERPLAHALELKLSHEGYVTETASSGSEGLKKALAGKFDMILLDLIMPEVDGFEVLAELKAKKLKTKVIVLSNLGQDEDKARAKDLGAIEYFVKANTPIVDIVKRVRGAL